MSTQAYVDLMFAWGHARIGDVKTAEELLTDAGRRLHATEDPAHLWLLDYFIYRIEQALSGAPHSGAEPERLLTRLKSIDEARVAQNSFRYTADRLRELSRILEPDDGVDPYLSRKRHRRGPTNELDSWLGNHQAARSRDRFNALRRQVDESRDILELGRFCRLATKFRDRLAASLGEEVIGQAHPHAVGALKAEWASHPDATRWAAKHRPIAPGGKDPEEWAAYRADLANPGSYIQARIHDGAAEILLGAIRLAHRLGRSDLVAAELDDFFRLAGDSSTPPTAVRALCALLSQVFFHRLSPRDRARAEKVSDQVTDAALAEWFGVDGWRTIPARLGLAALNYWLGRNDRCRPAMAETIRALSQAQKPPRKTAIVSDALDAIAQSYWPGPRDATR